MGWLFKEGYRRREMIAERAENWERTTDDDVKIETTCLAHCYRGGSFSGVLWLVWERTFTKEGRSEQPTERWIECDLLQYQRDYGWGYKDMEESMGPYFYSCPLGYLKTVPLEQFGGHAVWREGVKEYHDRQRAKRLARAGKNRLDGQIS